jgi:hypothetical protein
MCRRSFVESISGVRKEVVDAIDKAAGKHCLSDTSLSCAQRKKVWHVPPGTGSCKGPP